MSIYSGQLLALVRACSAYRERKLNEFEFQARVRLAEEQVVAAEERDLRDFLSRMEAQIELILFTTNQTEVYEKVLAIGTEIEARITSSAGTE